jgi:hypothetical protein
MKTLLLAGFLAVQTLAAPAMPGAKTTTTNYVAQKNLIDLYGDIKNVSWYPAIDNMIKAVFYVGDDAISVFFQQNGEYIATTHYCDLDELPTRLRIALANKFGDTPIQSCFELESPNEHAWYFETKTEKGKKKVWKVTEGGRIEGVDVAQS